jgi:hypothetical protein
MSALGRKQTFLNARPMSAIPPKADIGTQSRDVRFVPEADILRRRGYSGADNGYPRLLPVNLSAACLRISGLSLGR